MKFTATTDGGEVTWQDGAITGHYSLVHIIGSYVEHRVAVAFDYWAEREASLATPFDAYITIGAVIQTMTGTPPTFDVVPENPDGYSEEGAIDAYPREIS